MGGYSSVEDKAMMTIQIYDPYKNSWAESWDSLFVERYGLNAHVYDNKLYVFGGVNNGIPQLTWGLEKHDFIADPVIYSYNFNFNRIYATSVIYHDSLYIFGGIPDYDLIDENSPIQYMAKYNITLKAVEDSLVVNRYYSDAFPSRQMAVLMGDDIYLFGGEYDDVMDDISKYNIKTDSLADVSRLRIERCCGAAIAIDQNRILIIAGTDGEDRTLRETEIYDISENMIYDGPSLLKSRTEITAVLYEDSVYVFGGRANNGEAISFIEKISLRQIYDYINSATMIDENILEQKQIEETIAISNSPNPFNSTTTIRYKLSFPDNVHLTIYSVTGKKVKVLEEGAIGAGSYSYVWDGTNIQNQPVNSGLYFCHLKVGNKSVTHKIILIK
jgi:hypothetical protein